MKRILVIDDDETQRLLCHTILESAGYEVVEAPDGDSGLRLFRQQRFDLVITDIFMPDKNGFETIFELKSESPDIKIIAISGGATWAHAGEQWNRYHGALDAGEALKLANERGADWMLPKPFEIQQLLSIVGELLQTADRRSYLNRVETPMISPVAQPEQQRRILLIEDDEAQRELFRTVLEDSGYDVLEAVDGQKGVQLFQEQPCDLVITDIFMPNKDGIEAIMAIKTASPSVKIIAVSGGGSWEQHGEFVGAERSLGMANRFGADRTLQKPVSIQQLLELIEKLLPRISQT